MTFPEERIALTSTSCASLNFHRCELGDVNFGCGRGGVILPMII